MNKPPPPKNVPEAPSWGWLTDYRDLTSDEIDEIKQVAGVELPELDTHRFRALVAVAYARRLDADAYPWECAGRIPQSQLIAMDEDDGQEEKHVEAAAEAAVNGEESPMDPVSQG